MDIICINDIYTPEQKTFFSQHGVVTPLKDCFYTIRDVIKPSGKEGTGLLLNEIVNPLVPLMHPIMGQKVMIEPNFNIKRFSNLQGDLLSTEQLKEILKQQKEFAKNGK